MRRAVLLGVVGVALVVFPVWGAETVSIEPAEGAPPRIEVISADETGVSLVFELMELVTEDLSAGGRDFQLVSIPGGGFAGEVGEPAIPTFTRLVAIPDGAGVEVRVTPLEEEELTGYRLAPMQGGDGSGFAYDESAYARDRLQDVDRVLTGDPGILRDLRVASVSFQPVEFRPAEGTLAVTRRMRVEIDFVSGDSPGVLRRPRSTVPPSFDRLYRDLVLNYEGPSRGETLAPGTYLVICPDNSSVTAELEDLLDWRKRKGMPTVLATTSETGTSRTDIKNYIQGIYNDPESSLEYVVLVGDATGSYAIPTWYESLSGYTGEGDLPYSQLEGGDALPDVHLGRLSISTITELEHIVDKIVGYESAPYVSDPDWFTRACIVGDPTYSGASTVEAGRWLWRRLEEIGFSEADTIFTSPWVSRMTTALNRGDAIFGYRGYLNMSGWSNGNTAILTNGWQMPFGVIITCDTGSFASGTARSEAFLREWNSGAGEPRAAIGCIGMATYGTHTRYNNCLYYGILRGLIHEGQYTMGAALTRGSLEMYLNYHMAEPTIVEIWSHWANLMGDPAVDVWTSYPEPLYVAHPAGLPLGANSVTVSVSESMLPVEGAQVCLWKGDETYVVRYTDEMGKVELPVTTTTAGDMLLTVTRHNKRPYLATIPVATMPVYVGYASSVVDDDFYGESIGNNDGRLNPGETIELRVLLKNSGFQTVSGVEATLSSDDPFVTIVDSLESFGDIPGGGTAWSADDFGFIVANDCPHGHVVPFGLDATSGMDEWHSLIELEVFSAELVAQATTVYDGGNGRLDPGETADMSVLLHNDGGAKASNTTGTLISLTSFVTVDDASGSFGTIDVGGDGENTADPFTLTADAGTYEGYLANFLLIAQFTGGDTDTVHVSLTVGTRESTDPVGPDEYGYYAFDNTDVSYPEAPVYSWIEIDPAYGGDGTEVVLGDYGEYQDKSKVVDLPFLFTYYGQTYHKATVCSNGWLSMGSTILTTYRNWTIPGAGGPSGILAAFWDDLYQVSGSKVYQKHDEANHRWIVEWSRMRNEYSGNTETFEIILYDPDFHPSDTGDGFIVYQYDTVNNYDPRNGYATVGIESPDQLDGVLYTYFNEYPAGAAALAAGRAIRFVPVTEGPVGTLYGDVLNASHGDSPVEGAEVDVLGTARVFSTQADGGYSGLVTPGSYTVVASHVSFDPDTAYGVEILEGQSTELDFHLTDIAGPMITTTLHPSTDDTLGPYPIPVTIEEYSGLEEKVLYYSTGSPDFTPLTLVSQGGNDYLAEIPGQPYTAVVKYYVYARDSLGLETMDPPGAPAETHLFAVAPVEVILEEAFETGGGWTAGAPDDDATTGIWARAEPVGTEYNGYQIQPEYDHTPDPAEICFVTGNAGVGEAAGLNDVDGGKTTFFSPVFDLDDYHTATVSYWVWFSNNRGNNPNEDYWVVEVTNDGVDWVSLESTTQSTGESWVQRSFILDDYVTLTDQIQLRFVASDEGGGSLVEAAVDDFLITGIQDVVSSVGDGDIVTIRENRLDPCHPNPFNPATCITYRLAEPGMGSLRIYDVAGRLVATLVEGRLDAGPHEASWDGRSAVGRDVASGIYFLRLEAPGFSQVRRMTLLR